MVSSGFMRFSLRVCSRRRLRKHKAGVQAVQPVRRAFSRRYSGLRGDRGALRYNLRRHHAKFSELETQAMNTQDRIRQIINSDPIVLFMKGSPEFPQCGFSMRTSQALQACGAKFKHVDVLAD